MGLFKRGNKATRETNSAVPKSAPDLGELILQGEDIIVRLGETHRIRWGLGSAQRWDLDQTTGVITWTFPDKTVTAPAQIIGSHNVEAGSWLWAWANPSLEPIMCSAAERVREWGEQNGVGRLLEPKMDCDAEMAGTLAALSARVTEATGFYRALGTSTLLITFGLVTITEADGAQSTFSIAVAE